MIFRKKIKDKKKFFFWKKEKSKISLNKVKFKEFQNKEKIKNK